jgi:hypothetical protein
VRAPFRPEYRERMIELVRNGRSAESPAQELEPSAQCIRHWVRQDEDRAQHTTTRAWRDPPDRPIELLAETAGTCQRARRRRQSQKEGRPGGLPLRRPARNQALGLTIPCIVSQLTKALNQPVLVVSFGYMPKP